ncbi:hypothetical protein GOODEAATRI_033409, partial [Goodea atripinnis]
MSYDLHVICEGCLGPDHANLALTPQSTCPFCRRLPPEEKQRRLNIFSPLEGEFPIADQCSIKEALDIFHAGRESDDSAPETATDTISTPLLRTEDEEAGATPVQAQGLPMSATTPLTAMDALVSALPDIIAKVANAKGLSVPTPLAQLPPVTWWENLPRLIQPADRCGFCSPPFQRILRGSYWRDRS